jgi:hypothetical protein
MVSFKCTEKKNHNIPAFSFPLLTLPMSTPLENRQKVFEDFKRYPWHEDKVFQNGLQSILNNMPKADSEEDQEAELVEDLRLLKAKHFYFTRYQDKDKYK